VGTKLGLSIISLDGNDPYKQNNPDDPNFDLPVVSLLITGIRWYFKENISLWSEICGYDWAIGVSFKF
jgi:hypothetical protein